MSFLAKTWLAAGCLIAQAGLAQGIDPAATAALPTVQPAALEAHVRYLADDRLRGRLPGTPGYQLAVDYAVSQFKQNGVQPAGEKGTYTQAVGRSRVLC
jgi:hypothetical protein